MKRFLLVLSFMFLLTGCKEKEVKTTADIETKGYTVTLNNQELVIGNQFDKNIMGKEKKYSETSSCAFSGLDKTYTYDHFELTTYPKDNQEIIGNIYFLDSEVTTKEGVKITDPIDKVIEVYGDNYNQEDTLFTYKKDDMELRFIIENDTVSSIEYALIV